MVQTETQHTFQQLLERFYQENVPQDALIKVRAKAWDHFLELGLPAKNNEVYRKIKLRQLYETEFSLATTADCVVDQSYIYPECSNSYLIFVNGHLDLQQSCVPEEIIVAPLNEAINTYGAYLNNRWAKEIKEETDPFVTLNTALHQNGVFIYVPPKCTLRASLQIIHISDAHESVIMMPRVQLFVGNHASIDVIQSHHGETSFDYLLNNVLDAHVEDNAHVNLTQMIDDIPEQGWIFDAVRAHVKRNAQFKTFSVTNGAKNVRQDYRVILMQEASEVHLNGLWTLKDAREAHVNVLIEHQAPHCYSKQLFKGVLHDESRSSFEGKILVRQAAQKTDAFQLNSNLVLGERAHADSKPNLEIFADDVKASHGATIGQLSEEELFYMHTRGISKKEAEKLLTRSFCQEIIDLIPTLL